MIESEAKKIDSNRPAYLSGEIKPTLHPNIHDELHEFVKETREMWKDTLPFGRWLGLCKGLTPDHLRRIRDSLRDAQVRNPGAVFFHKVRQVKWQQKSGS